MRNREKQRENRRRFKKDPRLNGSGCMDLTAYQAIKNVMREEREARRRAKKTEETV